MDDSRCPVCDGRRCSTVCVGFPGAVYAPTGQGWFSYLDAVALEAAGQNVYWGDVWSYSRFGLEPQQGRVVVMDCETTGLDPATNEMVELAWHDMEHPQAAVQVVRLDHTLADFDEFALEVNRYRERDLGNPETWAPDHHRLDDIIRGLTEGAIIAGSNVAFDKGFIEERWGTQPWRHYPLEVGSYVAGFKHHGYPFRLAEIPDVLDLTSRPDHTAAGDVAVIIEALLAVRRLP